LNLVAKNLRNNTNAIANIINKIANKNIPKFKMRLGELMPTADKFELMEDVELSSSSIPNIDLNRSVGSNI
jgi:hypothetical protein